MAGAELCSAHFLRSDCCDWPRSLRLGPFFDKGISLRQSILHQQPIEPFGDTALIGARHPAPRRKS